MGILTVSNLLLRLVSPPFPLLSFSLSLSPRREEFFLHSPFKRCNVLAEKIVIVFLVGIRHTTPRVSFRPPLILNPCPYLARGCINTPYKTEFGNERTKGKKKRWRISNIRKDCEMEEEIVETLIARELATDRIECSSPVDGGGGGSIVESRGGRGGVEGKGMDRRIPLTDVFLRLYDGGEWFRAKLLST